MVETATHAAAAAAALETTPNGTTWTISAKFSYVPAEMRCIRICTKILGNVSKRPEESMGFFLRHRQLPIIWKAKTPTSIYTRLFSFHRPLLLRGEGGEWLIASGAPNPTEGTLPYISCDAQLYNIIMLVDRSLHFCFHESTSCTVVKCVVLEGTLSFIFIVHGVW